MTAVAAAPSFKDVETFGKRHKSSIEYVKELKKICITMLGIPESTVDTAQRSVELHASEDFYKGSLTLLPDDLKLLGFVSICFSKATLKFAVQILRYLVTLRNGGTYLKPGFVNLSDR